MADGSAEGCSSREPAMVSFEALLRQKIEAEGLGLGAIMPEVLPLKEPSFKSCRSRA